MILMKLSQTLFPNAIMLNKMHIAFYLFRQYQAAVLGNKELWIDSILWKFKNDYLYNTKIINFEERMFILAKFISSMDNKRAFEFISWMKDLILEVPESNFLVFVSNPIKIITMILDVLNRLKLMYPLLQFKIDYVEKVLSIAANSLIKWWTNINEVEDMFLDKLYNDIEVLDMIAYLNNTSILQNSVIDAIISNLYYGPYEREFFLSSSNWFRVIQNEVQYTPGSDYLYENNFVIFSYLRRSNSSSGLLNNAKDYIFSDENKQKVELNKVKNNRKIMGHMNDIFNYVIRLNSLIR